MQSDSMVMKFMNDSVADKYLSGYNLLEEASGDISSDVQLVNCCCPLQ